MNRIEAQFESYLKGVVPKDASETQRVETKRAFFAGAEAMMSIVRALGTDHVSEDEAEKMMEEASQELQQFCEDVLKGVA